MIDAHFLNWTRVLAKAYGGSSAADGEEVRIIGTGVKGPLVLSSNPQNPDAWRSRLQHVEKRAARAVNSSPVGFSCAVEKNGKQRKDSGGQVELVRLAFGLSLSLGKSCREAFTAYYFGNTKRVLWIQGQDRLFETCTDVSALDLRSKTLALATRQLLNSVAEVERVYSLSNSVQEQTKRLSEMLSSELRELDRLYKASDGQYAQLLGRATDSLKGDDAIEAEYLNRLEDLVSKYRLAVLFTPLSLGIVRCKVAMTTKGKTTEAYLPFVDHPFLIDMNMISRTTKLPWS